MPIIFNCGKGCRCSSTTCNGCIRAGTVCMIFQSRAEGVPEIPAEWADAKRLAGTEMVTLNVKGLALAEVAQLLSAIYKEPLAIPAERAFAPIKLSKKDTPLADVISELGLIAMSAKPRSRARSK